MLDRLKKLLGASINKGLDKLETPEILAERAQEELEAALKELTNCVAESLTKEKMLEKQQKTNTEQIDTWQKRAAVAVQAKNDDVAKQCLVKKNEAIQKDQELTTQLAQQKQNTATLKSRYKETSDKLKEFQVKKASMLSRAKAGEALANAHEITSNAPSGGMEKWEEKIQAKEALSSAKAQLDDESRLNQQFSDPSVEDELAAMKQQHEQNSGPKLIEDKGDSN
jgi:phage shock protein A